MASLWKHPQSRYWVACFYDKLGRRRKVSTKETDRKKAEKIAAAYEDAARRQKTAKQVREVISALHEEITGQAVVSLTVRQFADQWIEGKRPEVAQSTTDFYRQALDRFLGYLGRDADQGIDLVAPEHILRFRSAQTKLIGSTTLNHNIKALRMVFRAAKRDGYVSENPAEFVEAVRADKKEVKSRAFTLAELRMLLAAANPEWKSLIRFAVYTGQRLGDLAVMPWRSVDLGKNEVRFVTGKTGRVMVIPMAPALRDHVKELAVRRDAAGPVHPHAAEIVNRVGKSGRTGLVGPLSKEFAELLVSVGIREGAPLPKRAKGGLDQAAPSRKRVRYGLSFHSLRATATTLLHEAGIPSSVAQELIGHDSEQVHQTYVRVGREALEKAAASLPAI